MSLKWAIELRTYGYDHWNNRSPFESRWSFYGIFADIVNRFPWYRGRSRTGDILHARLTLWRNFAQQLINGIQHFRRNVTYIHTIITLWHRRNVEPTRRRHVSRPKADVNLRENQRHNVPHRPRGFSKGEKIAEASSWNCNDTSCETGTRVTYAAEKNLPANTKTSRIQIFPAVWGHTG